MGYELVLQRLVVTHRYFLARLICRHSRVGTSVNQRTRSPERVNALSQVAV